MFKVTQGVNEELLDQVDDHDVVVGTVYRGEAWHRNVRWVRVVNAFVKDSQGELWIPTRSRQKRMFPLCLDMSVGGHVGAGESYEQAFLREAREELNVPELLVYKEVGYLNPTRHHVSAFMKVYEICSDETPLYNPNDFVGGEWLRPRRLLEKIRQGVPAKGDLEQLICIFYT